MKYLIVVVLFVVAVGIFRALARADGGRKSGDGASSGDGSVTYLADQSSHAPPSHGHHHSHDGASHGDGGGGEGGGGGDGGGGGGD